jgi:hypothetical protein
VKKALESIGVILVIEGVAGIVHEFTGRFGLWTVVHYFAVLDGYEIFANIVLIGVGVVAVTIGNVGARNRAT